MSSTSIAKLPELNPQEASFVRLVAVEGLKIAEAATHPDVAIPKSTGYAWFKKEKIQNAILELLREGRMRNRMHANARIDKAWLAIDKAIANPNVTPTQFKAAAFVIMQANGEKESVESGTTIHVEVNTQLNNNGLAEQRARHSNRGPVIEGGFTLVDDDEA